ncbi:hypothetical protein PQ455_14795 [Sphingomonas naphthae]|uniref:Uncharacterized protein n=1 Tax=Sphingomonas naphthae TaxID=1813468 RepID=A0ABY7TJ20_9SPHN|nr:hypothetical protein [Sphingomonas naphthae]WCT72893.1 hypothetical protein PQ455_14795 [Sphingomonas naphthae]
MTLTADRDYYLRRAQECRDKASAAQDPAVRSVHHDMALRYEAAAFSDEPPPLFPSRSAHAV